MFPLSIYILKTILVSSILLGYYWISLRNTKFHYYNRFYLVATALFSLTLPLFEFNWFTFTAPDTPPVQQVVQYIYNTQYSVPTQPAHGLEQILTIALLSISVILVCIFLHGIYILYTIKAKSKITVTERFDFIETTMDEAPFSFFRNLFWRKDIPLNDHTGQRMLKHELTHIEQHHSYDKLLITLVTYIFWMNPFFWLIRKEIEVVHEFIADEEAVAGEGTSVLAEMLLQAHYPSNILSVGQSFFYSSIKRRIIMLSTSKKVSYSYARRLLILPIAIGIFILFSFTIQNSLKNTSGKQLQGTSMSVNKLDTFPAKYCDPKTGKIKGSFQIDFDGDTAAFKDIHSKKELFKVPLSQLGGNNSQRPIENFQLARGQNMYLIAGDSLAPAELFYISESASFHTKSDLPENMAGTRIIVNGKLISSEELAKMDPSSIKTIDIKGAEKGIIIRDNNIKSMTMIEPNAESGNKVVFVRADTNPVIRNPKVEVSAKSNVNIYQIIPDTAQVKTVAGYELKSVPETVVLTTSDANIAATALKDPRTLNVTVTGADDNVNKTYTIIQKQKERSELPKDVLYIIDGKEMQSGTISDIDPVTIKMVNVIKGDEAVKKYGEKAKNGVIEITTKK